MKRIVDTLTGDLFDSIPQQHPLTAGAWRFRCEIAHAMGDSVKSAPVACRPLKRLWRWR